MKQKAAIKINETQPNRLHLGRGVSQDRYHQTLVNLCGEKMLSNILEGKEGLSIGGRNVR